METRSRDWITSLWNLDIRPKNLCRLIFRVFLQFLGLSHTLLEKFREDEHAQSLPELSQDILMDIFSTLEIPDLVRAGSVCSSWHSAYTTLRNFGKYKLSQTPCLLYTSESAGESVACLYSLVEKRTYKLTLPDPAIRSRFLIGSSHGWLVTVDDRSEMHLVNPITGEQIALPSVITMEDVKPIFNESGVVEKYEYSWITSKGTRSTPWIYALAELRETLHYKAFLFSDTSKGRSIVVLIHSPDCHLSFARVGDDKWTSLSSRTAYDDYEDCNYKDGLLYAITKAGDILSFDINDHVATVKMIMERSLITVFHNMYIVHAPWGDLLTISRDSKENEYDDFSTLEVKTDEIKIYKVDPVAKKLIEANLLEDHALVLGHNQSLCLNTEEYPSLKANHVYFTDNDRLYTKGFMNNRRDIGVFDLDNNSSEELLVPQGWSNWPTPVWITPNITKISLEFSKH